MLENFGKKFDEGEHLDTGELNENGDRVFDNPEDFDFSGDEEKVFTELKPEVPNALEKGVCKHCGGDPCRTNCDYR